MISIWEGEAPAEPGSTVCHGSAGASPSRDQAHRHSISSSRRATTGGSVGGRRRRLGLRFFLRLDGGLRRLVIDGEQLAIPQIQPLLFVQIKRPGAFAAEDGELVAGFIDGAVAIEAFGKGDGGAGGLEGWRSAAACGRGLKPMKVGVPSRSSALVSCSTFNPSAPSATYANIDELVMPTRTAVASSMRRRERI